MMLPVDKLIQSLSRDQVRKVLVRVAAQLGLKTTSWRAFGITNLIITLMAATISPFTVILATAVRAQFLDYAEGVWLTLLAHFVYGVDREEATQARAACLTLVNAGAGEFNEPAGALIVRNPTTGKLYRNSAPIALAPFATLTLVEIEAIEVGAASTSAPTTITEMVTTWSGVTCTNTVAIVGRDEELDPALRDRCRSRLGALSPNGARDAFRFVALTRALNGDVAVNRVEVDTNSTTGLVRVIVAGPSGAIAGTSGNLATDLGKVHNAMVRLATPLCVTVTTESAVPVTVPVEYAAWLYSTTNVSGPVAAADVATRLASYFATFKIGGDRKDDEGNGFVFVNALEGEIKAVAPFFQVEVEGDDVELEENEVPVLGAITPAEPVTVVVL